MINALVFILRRAFYFSNHSTQIYHQNKLEQHQFCAKQFMHSPIDPEEFTPSPHITKLIESLKKLQDTRRGGATSTTVMQ